MKPALFANRSNLLDTIRAIAVTMVVLFHVATRYPMESLDIVARQFLRYGFLGVDIFYPLSGFLITRFLLGHAERGSIKAFFLRRVFRIVPLYLVAVTIFFIAAAACFTRSSPRLERWVLDLPKIGPAISDYRAGRGMPRRAKVAAITSVVVFGGLALIVIDVLWVRGTVAAAALVGIAVILRVRTRVDGVPPDDTGT